MIAHIISTGDEILLGDILDTNSRYLCQALRDLGMTVQKITCIGDEEKHISDTIKSTSVQADICIVTGGLGPTQDDVTALAAANAANVNSKMNQPALEVIKKYFKDKGFEYTSVNDKQALLPENSTVMDNQNGTAPGFYLKLNQCLFFFLPGPPKEMQPMYETSVQPILASNFNLKDDLIVERLTVFMLGESALGESLDLFDTLFPDLRLGIRVSFPTIEVKIRFDEQPENRQIATSQLADAKKWVSDQLGNKVVSQAGRSIVQEVADLLTRQKKTLAIAESCTGGLISNMVTDLSGSSDYFLFSGITYSNEAKMAALNVNEQTLIECGAVHEQTAKEMAQGARERVNADIAISTTGIAGPTGGTDQKPVGMVCIGIATKQDATAKTFVFKFDDREKNKRMFAMSALEILRKHLVSST